MGDAFDDLDAAGKEMDALNAGMLTPPPAQPPAPPPPETPPVAAPAASPAPPPVGPTPPAAPAEPFVFPATREEYERAMNPPPAEAPPPAAPAPAAATPAEPIPGQAVPWQRFEEVRQAAATAKAQLDMLMRLQMNPAAGTPQAPKPTGTPDPRIPKEYDEKVGALVNPVLDVRMEQERAKIVQEIEARYEPVLAKQRVETFIDNVDAALGTPPGAPGFRAVYPQVNAYFESLPPDQRKPFESVAGAIALKTIMEARGLLQPAAPAAPVAPAAPAAPPRFVGPAPALDPSTARAHMELRTGREPSRPLSLTGEQAALAINQLSPEAFAALKEGWRDGKRPESGEPDAFLR